MRLAISAWIAILVAASTWAQDVPASELLGADFKLANLVPPLRPMGDPKTLPIAVPPFVEHVRKDVKGGQIADIVSLRFDAGGNLIASTKTEDHMLGTDGGWKKAPKSSKEDSRAPKGEIITAREELGEAVWYGTANGLYISDKPDAPAKLFTSYGVNGPLASVITALKADDKEMLVGTPLGVSIHSADGKWLHVRGKQGLPYENVTAIDRDKDGNFWVGTTEGAIFYKTGENQRNWYYRWGQRYLPDNHVIAVACSPDGTPYFATKAGVSAIELKKTTLLEKAQTIEARVNKWHRRMGMVSECTLNDAFNPTSHTISDNDNDGLWTAYHIAAMSLCYGATKDPKAKESAKEGMHALYVLQNVTGIKGLVARSVVPFEEGKKMEEAWAAKANERQKAAGYQWRPTADGKLYWKSDTSSDEIDGHYLAFYAYWTHIAKDDPAEREQCIKQIRDLTNYIVDNNYQLIDWNGKRTRWGFWNPENLNDNPDDMDENGLNALQILSFLKVAHYITGDQKFKDHYKKLIVEHNYLSNILVEKKIHPDTNNHSDDQLGFVAWYPILQLERDPKVRAALHSGVRRHYIIVEPEKPSFYIFAYATIDPSHANLQAGIENLMEMPTDRRTWEMKNSQRADVIFDPLIDRFDKVQLLRCVPADERNFQKWNGNPYNPDGGGDGRYEDDGAAYLLPYWMARYHGFISEAQ
jgi:hypothetical protein